MDCKDARLLLEFAGLGERELEGSEADVLRQHLADCPDCAVAAHAEQRADEAIGRAMRAVPVPDGLRERLLQKVAAQRTAWHRRWFVRGGAAAAVLLAALGGYLYLANPLPAVDVKEVYEFVIERAVFSAKDVEDRFKELGVETVAPPDFNYHLLDSYGMDPLPVKNGRRVPHLLFFTKDENGRPVMAHVYILSGRDFDLEETLKKGLVPESGRRHVKLWPQRDGADYLYLIIYTGEEIKPFKAVNLNA